MKLRRASEVALAVLAVSALGCGDPPHVTADEICADPAAMDGRTVWLDAQVSEEHINLHRITSAVCDTGVTCCNNGTFVFVVPCTSTTGIALVPDDYPPDPDLPLTCGAGVPIAERCDLHCPDEAFELTGFLGTVDTTYAGEPAASAPWESLIDLRVRAVR